MNLRLLSEASKEIDFGEGTKVRIQNTTVTLKGTFHRTDSYLMTRCAREYEECRKTLEHERAEKIKLMNMVASRDTTIMQLNGDINAAKNQTRESLKGVRVEITQTITKSLLTAIEAVNGQLEKIYAN